MYVEVLRYSYALGTVKLSIVPVNSYLLTRTEVISNNLNWRASFPSFEKLVNSSHRRTVSLLFQCFFFLFSSLALLADIDFEAKGRLE